MSKLFVNKENVADNSNSITFRKQFVNGTVDLAHDCNKTGYYWIDAILKDPIPPYEGIDSSARFVVHTIAHDYKNSSFRYQEVIFDGGKYYRASWQGDDHYTSWSTEAASNLNLDLLASRISALEKQIGGVLTSLYTKLCGAFTSLEVA